MQKIKVKDIAIYGLLIAMTTVATMLVQIPIVGTRGYINLGDAMLLLAALLFGRRAGLIAGGIGSALADLLTGYSLYIPITLVVKGLEGWMAGALFERGRKERPVVATVPAGLWMALGYFLAELFLYRWPVPLVTVPFNLAQGVVGALLGTFLYAAVKKFLPQLLEPKN